MTLLNSNYIALNLQFMTTLLAYPINRISMWRGLNKYLHRHLTRFGKVPLIYRLLPISRIAKPAIRAVERSLRCCCSSSIKIYYLSFGGYPFYSTYSVFAAGHSPDPVHFYYPSKILINDSTIPSLYLLFSFHNIIFSLHNGHNFFATLPPPPISTDDQVGKMQFQFLIIPKSPEATMVCKCFSLRSNFLSSIYWFWRNLFISSNAARSSDYWFLYSSDPTTLPFLQEQLSEVYPHWLSFHNLMTLTLIRCGGAVKCAAALVMKTLS